MAKLTWHGHSTCTVVADAGATVVIDPFFGENPACELRVEDVRPVEVGDKAQVRILDPGESLEF